MIPILIIFHFISPPVFPAERAGTVTVQRAGAPYFDDRNFTVPIYNDGAYLWTGFAGGPLSISYAQSGSGQPPGTLYFRLTKGHVLLHGYRVVRQ